VDLVDILEAGVYFTALTMRQMHRGFLPVLLYLGLWLLLFVLIPPFSQDFPLNDDWAYSKGLFHFLQGNGLRYFGPSAPMMGQWLWAIPFVELFGEHHWVLRCSTILLSTLGLIAFYNLLVTEGISKTGSFWASAALAVNPLYFLMSGTFMTDIPALALSLISLAFYLRGIRRDEKTGWVLAMLFATLAAITRQNSALVPVCVGISLLWDRSIRSRGLALLAVIVPVLAGVMADQWYFRGNPEFQRLGLSFHNLKDTARFLFVTLHTLGLLIVPLIFTVRRFVWVRVLIFSSVFIVTALHLLGEGRLFPYWGNMITPWGQFGVNDVLPGERPILMGTELRLFLTLLGCLGAAVFVEKCLYFVRTTGLRKLWIPVIALNVVSVWLAPYWFDRYLLFLFPFVLLVMVQGKIDDSRSRLVPTAAMIACSAFVSLALMHDWLSWNRARWEIGERALKSGLLPQEIEGGLEWNGWHSLEPARFLPFQAEKGLTLPYTRRLFPQNTGAFAISFNPPARTEVLDREPYHPWLLGGSHRLYLVRKE
jgi:4-amino-4-deoxy-L-arabinose transferase-like glycosyltransferase